MNPKLLVLYNEEVVKPLAKRGILVSPPLEIEEKQVDQLIFSLRYFKDNNEHNVFAPPLQGKWASYYRTLTEKRSSLSPFLMRHVKMLEQLTDDAWEGLFPCPRAACACIAILPNKSLTVWGFNHHVGDTKCVVEENHCVSAIHAEISMICNAAQTGVSIFGAIVISNQRPCQRCLMAMREAGVMQVYYINDYHSSKHSAEFVSPELMKVLNVRQVYEANSFGGSEESQGAQDYSSGVDKPGVTTRI